jgi:hypothetical protein
MEKQELNACCDIGMSGSCPVCDFAELCKGKWLHTTQ